MERGVRAASLGATLERAAARPLRRAIAWALAASGYDRLRVLLGLLLLAAAGLKAHQLATEPVFGTGLFDSRWVLIGVVEFELLFGLWLFAGIGPKATWATALSCFSLFTLVSLYKYLWGYSTCGCFGRLPVHPLYTAGLDLVIVLSLLVWRPKGRESLRPTAANAAPLWATAVSAMWFAIGAPAALAVIQRADATLSDAGDIIGNGKAVLLKPETWAGKRFPVLGHMDIGRDLGKGMWIALLHRTDCSACREAAAQYEALAKDLAAAADSPRVALIECSPYAQERPPAGAANLVIGRLTDSVEWQLPGPHGFMIDEGKVQRVFTNARDLELVRAIWGSSGSRGGNAATERRSCVRLAGAL